jgi:hypothetical protein
MITETVHAYGQGDGMRVSTPTLLCAPRFLGKLSIIPCKIQPIHHAIG